MIPVLGMSPKVLGYRWAGMYAPDGSITEARLAFLAVSCDALCGTRVRNRRPFMLSTRAECTGQIKVTDA